MAKPRRPSFYDDERLFYEDRGGMAFREVFTPLREGPLPPRPRESGKGGPSINQGAPPTAPPANITPPVVSGTPQVGQTLTVSNGTWTNSPASFSYIWMTGVTQLPPGTSSTYVVQAGDVGNNIRCYVEAINSLGNSGYVLSSNYVGPVVASGSTWSAADASAGLMTLSNGNMTVTSGTAGNWTTIRNTISQTSGKWYIEFSIVSIGTAGYQMFGLANAGFPATQGNYLGAAIYSAGVTDAANYVSAGFVSKYTTANYPAAGDVWALAVDFGAGNIWIAQNNVWINSSNPATGSLPIITFTPATVGALFAGITVYHTGDQITLQPTAASQKYLPPGGFQAWDGGPVTPMPSSVWSAADATATGMTLSNGGLTVTPGGAGWEAIRTSIAKSSGKLYIEFAVTVSLTDWQWSLGLANSTINLTVGGGLGKSNYSCGILVGGDGTNVSTGFTSNYNSSLPSYQPTAGTVFALAVDFAAGSVWIAQDNTWSDSSNPATGSLPVVSFTPATVGPLFAGLSIVAANAGVWTLQPTAASQKYAPPSGFTAWG